jgi:hypothetical protein
MNGPRTTSTLAEWLRDRSLTLTMIALFVLCAAGQIWAGWTDNNRTRVEHGQAAIAIGEYVRQGHMWEALFENWESEFLQMSAFVVLTAYLLQVGSPESRRPRVHELVDADPRAFAHMPDVPWPVRRGGWILRLYEYSLGGVLFLLFLLSFAGHAVGGWREQNAEQALHGEPPGALAEYVLSSRFWFESLQNWQSEFLSVGVMVWLAVYLRQRGSPESKPVHASHDETGR